MNSMLRNSAAKLALAGLMAIGASAPTVAFANHSVLIEGETDFDGDGVVGSLEDADGDAVFGKINSALGSNATPFPGSLANNGSAIIVTSGRFPEVVMISGPVTLEAAPGVSAVIEAFLSPAVDGPRLADFDTPMSNNMTRQMAPGVIINAPAIRPVVIRNVTIRNWTDGIQVQSGQVLIDDARIEHNISHGINVLGSSQVAIVESDVSSTGFRINPNSGQFPDNNPPTPGIGVRFQNLSKGDITRSSITTSFSVGLLNQANFLTDVAIQDVQFQGNQFQNGGSMLRLNCRAATNNDFNQAEICVQSVLRGLIGAVDGQGSLPPSP